MDKLARTTQEIGRRLRSARAGAGLTLASVARRANLSEGFLSKLERGQATGSIANLIQLAEVLGLGLHELFSSDSAPARTRVAVHRGAADSPWDVGQSLPSHRPGAWPCRVDLSQWRVECRPADHDGPAARCDPAHHGPNHRGL